MAFITAETRSDLIALSVGMLKQAPSAALLDELIAISVGGGSLADAADHIAKTAAFKAEYPSFQTAEQYAAEIFDNITTGGTVTAAIRTAVIELATGFLTSGLYSKAGLALAITDYLSQPAALLNDDFADIAQSVQNRSAAAEYFVVTKELGGSTAAELAAAIASVTSDAATLTAANTAADATASAEAVVAGQTFTLTTGIDEFVGNGNDNTFNAGVVNEATGAAITTISNGDEIDGGAGTDTLNITATAANNTSLTGLTVKGVEVVNITGADNLAASTTATDAAKAGVAQVVSTAADGSYTVQGQVQTIDLRDLATTSASSATGTIDVTVAGAAYSVAVGASKSASQIATAIATALSLDAKGATAGIGGTTGIASSVTSSGSIVTVNLKPTAGTISAITIADGSTAPTYTSTNVFDEVADVQIAIATAATLSNAPVAKAAKIAYTAGTSAGTISIGNEAIKVTVAAAASAATVEAAIAAAINGKITDHETQTVTFTGAATGTGSITVGGISVAVAATASVGTVATAVEGAINGKVVTLADGTQATVKATATAGAVLIEYPAELGNVAQITYSDGTAAFATSTTNNETLRGSGVVAAAVVSGDVIVTYGLGYGAGSQTGPETTISTSAGTDVQTSSAAGTAALLGGTASGSVSDVEIIVNGNKHSVGNVTVNATVLAGVAQGESTSKAILAREFQGPIATELATVLGDAVTIVSNSGDAKVVSTVNYAGVEVPTISVAQGTATIGATTVTTAAVEQTNATAQAQVLTITDSDNVPSTAGELVIGGKSYGAVGFSGTGITGLAATLNSVIGAGSASVTVTTTAEAVAQQEKLVFGIGDATSTETVTVGYGTDSYITAAMDSTTTKAEYAVLVSDALNTLAGSKIAEVVGEAVVVTATTPGADLPLITVAPTTNTSVMTTSITEQRAKEAASVTSIVTLTAPTAGEPLPLIQLSGATIAETAQNIGSLTSTTTAGTASIAGSQFVGAEQIWLKGSASNDTDVTATTGQTVGLSGVTGIDGSTFSLGATASKLAISGATTATGKTANVKGGGTTLNIIGTGSTGFSLTETNTTDKMAALAVNTSGSTVLTVAGLSALETVTQSGAGGLTLSDTALTKVHTVTTGAGADKITMATITAEDNVATAKDETVTAAVNTGGGADTLVLTLDGAGLASANTGAGDDTIKVNNDSTFSGTLAVDAGEGNDTIWLQTGFAELSSKVTVDGGAGTNTLALAGDTAYVSGDYTKLTTYASNIDALTFFGAVGSSTAVDGSKLGGIKTFTVTTGTNKFAKVLDGSSFTNTVIVRAATDYLGAIANTGSTAVTIDTADYTADTLATDEIYDAVYGQDISITNATLSAQVTYTVTASDVTITGVSVGGAADASAKSNVVLAGQMETATVILSSARGTTTNAAADYMSSFTITTDPTTGNDAMQGLKSIVVAGAGVVVIDAGDDGDTASDSTAANLKVINLAGMTDFEKLDVDGDPAGANGTYQNLSTSTLTLNNLVAETVTLGGALDKVITNSTPDEMDSIVGFSLVATAVTTDADDLVDYKTSDVIDIAGTDYSTADNDADGSAGISTAFVKDETKYVSKDAGLLELSKTSGKAAVFHAEGNTYIFVNDADTELDSGDVVVELVGTYDLDLLINVII